MVPHLYPKTPGTQKSTQNLKITLIFRFWVKASLTLKTDQKFSFVESFNQKQISGLMVAYLYPKTPGTQKSAQNSQITVIFG